MRISLFILCISFLIQSCSSPVAATQSKKENSVYYSCNMEKENYTDKTVILKAEELRNCFLTNNDKIVWISSYWQACPGQDINGQKQIYEKYKDKIDWVILSETFDVKEVKTIEKTIEHSIYFIDPIYESSRLKNAKGYMKDLFKENASEDVLNHTCIFVKNNKVIAVAYDDQLTDDFFKKFIQ